jgi:hypothetical protein
MGSSRRLATAAVSVSLALAGTVAVAHADASPVLYVDGFVSNCTDSGTGTQAAPYCTIQAAANAAVAGDTVQITGGTYQGLVDVKSAGTAAAPIVFQPEGIVAIADPSGQTGPALSFDGASYVSFDGNMASSYFSVADVAVNDSSNVTANGLNADEFRVTGISSAVALTRSKVAYAQVGAGSSGDVISTNIIEGSDALHGISVSGAANTAITSNTIAGYLVSQNAINITGSTGTAIENNIAPGPVGTSSAGNVPTISVDASSATSTTLDYNVVYPYSTSAPTALQIPYSWAGNRYAGAKELDTATGQGAHDLNANLALWENLTRGGSAPQLNSANSSAPGMLATDYYGNGCSQDPVLPVTGSGSPAYCERGAVQQSFTNSLMAATTTPTTLSVVLSSWMRQTTPYSGVAESMSMAPTPAVSYTIAWGDGRTQTVQASSTEIGTSTTHNYAKAGTYTITDTANLTDGTTVSAQTSATTVGSGFTPLGPVRILDTRSSTAGFRGRMPWGTCYSMPVGGVDGIPVSASAVALNLTVTDAKGSGGVFYLNSSSSSSLNYNAGETVANSAIVPLNPDGSVDVCSKGASNASADVIVDVTGFFARSSGAGYQPLAPDRILDTRQGIGAPKAKIAANSGLSLQITGVDSIPAGVSAVAVHVTETNATGGGWIAAAPDGTGVPGTSSLNYTPGSTVSNTMIVPVAGDGSIELYNGATSGSVDLIADVSGYFSPSAPEAFVPVTPYRAVDTRLTKGTLGAYGMGGYQLDTAQGIPANATFAANLTATDETNSGHLTVFPFNTEAEPNISSLNFNKEQTVASFGLFGSPTGGDGVNVSNESDGSTDVIFDVFGYFSND